MIKSTNFSKQWYAIYTMPRAEKKVEERFINKGVETYLPLMTSVRIWSDRKKKLKIPLIPGYVFIQSNKEGLKEIYRINGALGIVRHLGEPAKVNQVELDNLRILTTEPDSFQAIDSFDLKAGERFEINFGNFTGLVGYYVRHAGKFRAVICLDSINKMFEVNVPISFLQRVRNESFLAKAL
jgi:transcription antitermination factor NusG